LEALNFLEKQGVSRIYLTPHIMDDSSTDKVQLFSARFEELTAVYTGNIELRLAAEYMLDNEFEHHLHRADKLLTIGNNHVLLETSYMNPPIDFQNTLQNVINRGYFVILAHPERYAYMDFPDYKKLKKIDALHFQLNLLSLVGQYGKTAQKKSLFLLENNYYNFVGSDIHNLDIHCKGYDKKMLKKAEIKKLKQLFDNNSQLWESI
jgi:tyrosine-protein phosphatase YwqE